jgi:cysteine desulfurase
LEEFSLNSGILKNGSEEINLTPLYFDYCASTPIDPMVSQVLMSSSLEYYANPSSTHMMGLEIEQLINEARISISNLLGVNSSELIFTSGATESNNLAIFGVIRALKNNNRRLHVITTKIEHPSVIRCIEFLNDQGVDVTYLPVDCNGMVNIESLKEAIKENTALVSIMQVNNETGAIQPIEDIGNLLKNYPHIYFHVDGVQGFGKIAISLEYVDLYTISAHKIGGPKGMGLLMKKGHVNISPIMFGGNQEFGIRPGTTNITGVLSMQEAIKIAVNQQEERLNSLTMIYKRVYSVLHNIDGLHINSPSPGLGSPHILNFSYTATSSAIFLSILAKKGIIASSQSACSSKGSKESRVLMAICNDQAIASSSIRLSFHESITDEDIDRLIEALEQTVILIKTKKVFSFLADKSLEEQNIYS